MVTTKEFIIMMGVVILVSAVAAVFAVQFTGQVTLAPNDDSGYAYAQSEDLVGAARYTIDTCRICDLNSTNGTPHTRLELYFITNQSIGYVGDQVIFVNPRNRTQLYSTQITAEGLGLLTVNGKPYTIEYFGVAGSPETDYYVHVQPRVVKNLSSALFLY